MSAAGRGFRLTATHSAQSACVSLHRLGDRDLRIKIHILNRIE